MEFLILKWVHILSATVLFGTGIGTAFFMFMANRSRDVAGIAFTTRQVVLADWLFTAPAGVVQLLTGLWLVRAAGHEFSDFWVVLALILFAFAGLCWLPVVALQIRLRDMAADAVANGQPLPARYWRLERWWVILGSLAFPALVVVFYLMVFRPV